MSFRSDAQICRVARVLLGSLHLQRLWTEQGPSELACQYLEQGSPLSHGEHLTLLVCWDLWNGQGGAKVGDLLGVFDATRVRLLASLLIAHASGGHSVERWLLEHETKAVVV